MLIHEKIKAPLLAGALMLALVPVSAGAAGGGGHMGGATSFHAMGPTPATPNLSSASQRAGGNASGGMLSRPQFSRPVTGTRLPTPVHPIGAPNPVSAAPVADPPPAGQGDEQ